MFLIGLYYLVVLYIWYVCILPLSVIGLCSLVVLWFWGRSDSMWGWAGRCEAGPVAVRLGRSPWGWAGRREAGPVAVRLGRSSWGWAGRREAGPVAVRLGRSPWGSAGRREARPVAVRLGRSPWCLMTLCRRVGRAPIAWHERDSTMSVCCVGTTRDHVCQNYCLHGKYVKRATTVLGSHFSTHGFTAIGQQ